MLLCDPEERWILFVGLGIIAAGGFIVDVFVLVFGLLSDLLIILSTANGDVEIFGDDEPVRSASLRKEPAGDFSDGSFVANCCCCCCCCLEGFTDDVGEGVGRCDNDKSLFEEEWVLIFDDSFECFLYWENKSIVRSITEDEFGVELRLVDESDWDDGETIAGFAIGRIISDLFVLFNDCSDN